MIFPFNCPLINLACVITGFQFCKEISAQKCMKFKLVTRIIERSVSYSTPFFPKLKTVTLKNCSVFAIPVVYRVLA